MMKRIVIYKCYYPTGDKYKVIEKHYKIVVQRKPFSQGNLVYYPISPFDYRVISKDDIIADYIEEKPV